MTKTKSLFLLSTALLTSACATPTYTSQVDTGAYLNKHEGVSYYLPRQLHKIELSRDKECNTVLKLTEGDLVPDENVTFLLNTASNPVRDDTLDIKTTPTGLLTSSKTTTSGQLDEIFIEIAGALAASPLGVQGFSTSGDKKECQEPQSKFIAQYDLAKSSNRAELISDAKKYGYTLTFSSDLNGAKNSLSNTQDNEGNLSFTAVGLQNKSGIFYRRPRVYTANVMCETTTTCAPEIITLNLPQFGNIGYIEPRGSSFTAESDTLTFTNGMLTDWNTVRKSPVAEVAKIPVKIMKEIISVPSELLTLRSSKVTKTNTLETNLATLAQTQEANERAALKRQIELAIITECLSKSQDDAARLECLKLLPEG